MLQRAPRRLAAVVLILSALPLLSGCGPVLVAGAAAGASVVHERRGPQTVLQDDYIELRAMHLYHQTPEIHQRSRISVTSYNYTVLLTGQAQTAEVSERFAAMVADVPRVRRVINEVTIGPHISMGRESSDVLLTSRVKLAMTGIDIEGFDPTRVKVVTEDGVVYLMGLVTPAEAHAAVEKARYVPGVEKVVRIFEYVEPGAAST